VKKGRYVFMFGVKQTFLSDLLFPKVKKPLSFGTRTTRPATQLHAPED